MASYPPHPLRPYPPLVVNAALTGMVPRRERVPHVPVTAEQIVADAVACVQAGATIVHLHARRPDEEPEWRRDAYGPVIAELRRRCPGLVLCVSPSGASLNAPQTIVALAERMRDTGIRPELEVFDTGMAALAHQLLDKGVLEPPLYANLLLGAPNTAPATARDLA